MGSDVGQIFPTASLHRDHSILYVLVCEKSMSRGWDKEIPHGVLLMEQLVLSDKWARNSRPAGTSLVPLPSCHITLTRMSAG